jgi:hypothetical protein
MDPNEFALEESELNRGRFLTTWAGWRDWAIVYFGQWFANYRCRAIFYKKNFHGTSCVLILEKHGWATLKISLPLGVKFVPTCLNMSLKGEIWYLGGMCTP